MSRERSKEVKMLRDAFKWAADRLEEASKGNFHDANFLLELCNNARNYTGLINQTINHYEYVAVGDMYNEQNNVPVSPVDIFEDSDEEYMIWNNNVNDFL